MDRWDDGMQIMGYFIATWKNNGDIIWLVVSTAMKNMKVSWDHDSQYMEK